MNRKAVGINFLVATIVVAIAMMVANLLFTPVFETGNHLGLALPSPNLWQLQYPASWIINTVMIIATVPFLIFFNKKFNFVQGPDMVAPVAFLLLTATNFFISREFCSSTLVLWVNLICLRVLFDTFKSSNATQEHFLIATFLSVGSMVQYAFIPMIAAYAIAAVVMKSMHFKEVLAYLLGLVAPYWVALGCGLLSFSDFSVPSLINIFTDASFSTRFFIMTVGIGIMFLVCSLLCMNNAVRLWAGNTPIRCMNYAINIVGYASAICMIVDFNNLTAYTATLNLWMAVQVGNLFALFRIRKPRLLMLIISLIIIAFWLFALIYI